jgi:hypothetical protein
VLVVSDRRGSEWRIQKAESKEFNSPPVTPR